MVDAILFDKLVGTEDLFRMTLSFITLRNISLEPYEVVPRLSEASRFE
jgi:hypothetical protein